MNLQKIITRAEETLCLADSVTLESTEGRYAQAVVALRDCAVAALNSAPQAPPRWPVDPNWLDQYRAWWIRRLVGFDAAISPAPKEGE